MYVGIEDQKPLEYFSTDKIKQFKRDNYIRNWLEVMRDLPIALSKVRMREKGASLFASMVMRKAMRFQITEAALLIITELPTYHLWNGSNKQIERYLKDEIELRNNFNAEGKVKRYSYEVNKYFIKKLKNSVLIEKLNTIILELDELSKGVKSYGFQIYYFDLKLKKYQLEDDDNGVIDFCEYARNELLSKRFKVSNQALFMFNYPVIPILIKQGKYDRALDKVYTCKKLIRKKNPNWFVIDSYEIIINFRKLDFDTVSKLLRKIKDYPTALVKERYDLFKSYHSLISGTKVNSKKYSNNRFLNDLFEYQKDKGGYYRGILICQIIHLIKNGDDKSYNYLIDKRDAIDQSLRRFNARVGGADRTAIFLKMLLQIPSCDFNRDKYKTKVQSDFDSLSKITRKTINVELELIPYYYLHELVLSLLK